MSRLLFSFFIPILLIACTGNGRPEKEAHPENDSTGTNLHSKSGLEIEPRLANADSLQILYFDDPDGDSLRYTRFYRYRTTSDAFIIRSLLSDLHGAYDQKDNVKPCRSEGKIFLFARGEPLKTVYFSTRCESCCYLYFIKDGAFLYFDLSPDFNRVLKKERTMALKP